MFIGTEIAKKMLASRAGDKESSDEGISSKADTEENQTSGSAPVLYVWFLLYYIVGFLIIDH